MPYSSGLVSITFRQLKPLEIISLVMQTGQSGIEWGGDVHVPPGDLANARIVQEQTVTAGLHVAAYGSYYRCGESNGQSPDFETILETALALGAPSIRVWAGQKSPEDCEPEESLAIRADFLKACRLAERYGVNVATEFHGGTLTETRESTCNFFAGIEVSNACSLWQPHQRQSISNRLLTIDDIMGRLLNVHVFQWGPDGFNDRRPLAEGIEEWRSYLGKIASDGRHRWALLEFVEGDSPENYLRDAETLNTLLGKTLSA